MLLLAGLQTDEPEQWFDIRMAIPVQPPEPKYVWRVINGKRTKVIDFVEYYPA